MPRINASETTAAIVAGDLDVTAWSDEELVRGQRKDRNGTWRGRPPKVVAAAIHHELVRRRMSKAYELLTDNVQQAVQVLAEVMNDPQADKGVRVKAATTIIDRVLPKVPVQVTLTATPLRPWEEVLMQAAVMTTDRSFPEFDEIDGVIDADSREV